MEEEIKKEFKPTTEDIKNIIKCLLCIFAIITLQIIFDIIIAIRLYW